MTINSGEQAHEAREILEFWKETVSQQITKALDDLKKLGRAPTDLGVK